MNVNIGDILEMKKPHPCGSNRMIVMRVGADFRLKCEKCGHDFMVARSKCEKKIKKIISADTENRKE
ncbi:MAG: DUF951 domain-containing protein [Ruminococcaceae bacterium]|nr:DUF951 domain-containing protein [Oscillospiraceae bacterium]